MRALLYVTANRKKVLVVSWNYKGLDLSHKRPAGVTIGSILHSAIKLISKNLARA